MNTIYFLFFAVFLGAYITLLCMLLAHPFSKGQSTHKSRRNDVTCGDNFIMPATPERDSSLENGNVVTPGQSLSVRDYPFRNVCRCLKERGIHSRNQAGLLWD